MSIASFVTEVSGFSGTITIIVGFLMCLCQHNFINLCNFLVWICYGHDHDTCITHKCVFWLRVFLVVILISNVLSKLCFGKQLHKLFGIKNPKFLGCGSLTMYLKKKK